MDGSRIVIHWQTSKLFVVMLIVLVFGALLGVLVSQELKLSSYWVRCPACHGVGRVPRGEFEKMEE